MSMISCVGLVATTVMPPPVPAGTIAIFAVTVPVGAFSVDEPGCDCPAGQVLRNPSVPADGTTVMLRAYACAVAGMPQGPESTGNVLGTDAARAGLPNAPAPSLVSARRQGVTG